MQANDILVPKKKSIKVAYVLLLVVTLFFIVSLIWGFLALIFKWELLGCTLSIFISIFLVFLLSIINFSGK